MWQLGFYDVLEPIFFLISSTCARLIFMHILYGLPTHCVNATEENTH